MFTTQIACEHGDLKIGWDDANDAAVRAIIEKKLEEGYHFFREFAGDPQQHLRVRRVADVSNHVIIPDEDFHALFTEGKIAIVTTETIDTAQDQAGPERVRTAEAVMQGHTVAHRGLQAG